MTGTGPATDVDAGDPLGAALVAELAKKTGVCWLRYGGRSRAVWHVWFDDSLCLVTGGEEQALPDLADGDEVEVVMRSKDNGGRLVTWAGRAAVVRPDAEDWAPVTAALVADRLNLPDLAAAPARWAEHSRVWRVRPTGRLVERPGDLPDDAHLAPPPESEATTRGRLPRVLHRRQRHRPRLS